MLSVLIGILGIVVISLTVGLYTFAYFSGGKNKLIGQFVFVLMVCLLQSIFLLLYHTKVDNSAGSILYILLTFYTIVIFLCFIKQSFLGNI